MEQLRNCTQRDFFRWVKLPIATTSVKVPLLMDAKSMVPGTAPTESLQSISVILPSDMLCALHDAGPEASHIGAVFGFLFLRSGGFRQHFVPRHVKTIVFKCFCICHAMRACGIR